VRGGEREGFEGTAADERSGGRVVGEDTVSVIDGRDDVVAVGVFFAYTAVADNLTGGRG
jgi:hypothetical protein